MSIRSLMLLILTVLLLIGCSDKQPSAGMLTKVKLALNWVPEPEFGGFYAAQVNRAYRKHGLDVEILPGGAGTPTVQMVAAGQVEFAIVSADEIAIARVRHADVVALFAVYQTNPQGIMVHESRHLTSIADVFKSGTLAIEMGLPYTKFLQNKYGFAKIQVVPYAGGVAQFLADKNLSQQCFVTSEPLAAQRQRADPKVFLIAEAGYNPYTAVLAARGDYVRGNPGIVKAMVAAVRAGWRDYLADPAPTNQTMGQLNKVMDAQTFTQAAAAQKPLIENDFTHQAGLGAMTSVRWETLNKQLVELGVIAQAPPAQECFVDIAESP